MNESTGTFRRLGCLVACVLLLLPVTAWSQDGGGGGFSVGTSHLPRPPRRSSRASQAARPSGLSSQLPVASERVGGFVPRHQRSWPQPRVALQDEAPVPAESPEEIPGSEVYEQIPQDLPLESLGIEPPLMENCHAGSCAHCCLIPCPIISLDNLELAAGVQGFTGPVNRGETGSFGFYQAINAGAPLPCAPWGQLGMQLGARTTQSNLSGALFLPEERTQLFVTGGIFRRVDWGLQGGVVVDYLYDDWFYEASFVQVRGEISWVTTCGNDFGFWFAGSTRDEQVTLELEVDENEFLRLDEELQPTDLYAFFYRHRFGPCGQATGRLFAGFSNRSDGLIGADLRLPLTEKIALESAFTYLVPREGRNEGGFREEAWNVAIGLVWYPGCLTGGPGYYRPLFNVADNGTFLVDRQ